MGRDKPILPRDEQLHFLLLALLLTLAWQFVLEGRISASSFLEMVYLVWGDPYISLLIPLPSKAKIFFSCFTFYFTLKKFLNNYVALYTFTLTRKVRVYKTSFWTIVDPWTNRVWTVEAHLHIDFFSIVDAIVLQDSCLVESADGEQKM